MVTVTVTPREGENLYSLLVKEEVELRRNKQGTLHRHGPKRRGNDKWVHKSYPGWIRFERSLGGTLIALVSSKQESDEWRLLNSFIGFLHRHFREEIGSILLTYGPEA